MQLRAKSTLLTLLASWPVRLAVRFVLLPLVVCAIVWAAFPDAWRAGQGARLALFAAIAMLVNSRLWYSCTGAIWRLVGLLGRAAFPWRRVEAPKADPGSAPGAGA